MSVACLSSYETTLPHFFVPFLLTYLIILYSCLRRGSVPIQTLEMKRHSMSNISWNERCLHNAGLMVCNLPDEIYGQIFGCDCEETLHLVFLSHVCRRWRAACFETPSLWAHIDICLPFQGVGHSFTEICVRLERSAGSALTIKLHVDGYPHVETLRALESALRPHLSRCKRIRAFAQSYDQLFCFPLPKGMTILEELVVGATPTSTHRGVLGPGHKNLSFLEDNTDNTFPELRTLSFHLVSTRAARLPPLQLPKVQHLHFIGCLPTEDVPPIIDGASTHLETLVWRPLYGIYPRSPCTSLLFPRLYSLSLGGAEVVLGTETWEAPLLQHLTIDASRAIADRFLQHANFPSIISLALAQISYSPSLLRPFFQRHQNLRTIRMRDATGLETFLSHVAPNKGPCRVFTNVQKLELVLNGGSSGRLGQGLSSLLRVMTTRTSPTSASDTVIASKHQKDILFNLTLTFPWEDIPAELSLLALQYPSNVYFRTQCTTVL